MPKLLLVHRLVCVKHVVCVLILRLHVPLLLVHRVPVLLEHRVVRAVLVVLVVLVVRVVRPLDLPRVVRLVRGCDALLVVMDT